MRISWMALFLFVFIFSPHASHAESFKRELFVSVVQDPPVLSSKQAISDLIDFSKRAKINILFVQIYRANQAWFSSKVADSKPYEECLTSVGEDPLALLIQQAHEAGIQVHAWLNLLSLSANEQAPLLQTYGASVLMRNEKEKQTLSDYKIDNQYFLEPGDARVQDALATVVDEVVTTYPNLDGIQFDYIRYPDWHPFYGYTPLNTERFLKQTKKKKIEENDPAWKKYKRNQVTDLVKRLSKIARQKNPHIQVSTTGLMPYSRAYHEAFQDWKTWVKSGLIDFVTLMCYTKRSHHFADYIQDGKHEIPLQKMNVAVGAYELGAFPEVFQRQLFLSHRSGGRGVAILHYESLLNYSNLTRLLLNTREKL